MPVRTDTPGARDLYATVGDDDRRLAFHCSTWACDLRRSLRLAVARAPSRIPRPGSSPRRRLPRTARRLRADDRFCLVELAARFSHGRDQQLRGGRTRLEERAALTRADLSATTSANCFAAGPTFTSPGTPSRSTSSTTRRSPRWPRRPQTDLAIALDPDVGEQVCNAGWLTGQSVNSTTSCELRRAGRDVRGRSPGAASFARLMVVRIRVDH